MTSTESNAVPTQLSQTSPTVPESTQRNEGTVAEDSNNNTSLNDREHRAEGSAIESNASQPSPSVREIHKNSWLKRMPCTDKWAGKFPKTQKLEKFWVVFCVHDDNEAFLEFYENRRSAYSHIALSSVSLSKCLHISPTIIAQGNDHEFVITLETQVIRLAASTNEQMLEWMDTLSTKLREMGVLEPKDNLYSKEPICSKSSASFESDSSETFSREDFNRLTMRDPNSPLPPVPGAPPQSNEETDSVISNSTLVFIRNPPAQTLNQTASSNIPINSSIITVESTPSSSRSLPETVFNFDPLPNPDQGSRRSSISQASVNSSAESEQRISSNSTSSSSEQASLYEPLFYSGASNVSVGIRNPNYENPPHPQRHIVFKPTPALPPRPNSDPRQMPLSNDSIHNNSNERATNLSQLSSASEPSLNGAQHNSSAFVMDSTSNNINSSSGMLRNPHELSNERHSSFGARGQKPLSLREVQVQKLQSEISHKSGVRLVLRKKDCVNAIAFVECFNSVWVAGWKQKEHPLLHNTFHVGDCIISISGHRIQSVQDAHQVIKQQQSTIEFVIRRVPYGKVLAIKREYEGQDLGIVREGGTAEIKEVKLNNLAAQHGLTSKATSLDGNSLCNWVITEINHRPINLFFKENEIQDRLNAVGLDISILVQPLELVKAMKKQLKLLRSYKDYIVQ